MKEENLKRAKDVVNLLETRRRQLEYLDDSYTMMELNLYRDGKGSVNVGHAIIQKETQNIIKIIVGSEVRKQIKDLENELRGL